MTTTVVDGSYILNLDNKQTLHWPALFVKDSTSKGLYYFDSYGTSMIYPKEVKQFCHNFIYSDDTIQSRLNSDDTMWLLLFVFSLLED